MTVRSNGVQKVKVSDSIVEHITSMIRRGELKPGDKLPAERELSISLGVSRTALREAVRTLSLMDLLTVRQGGGTFVAELMPGSFMKPLTPMLAMGRVDTMELIEARRIIEPKAAHLCAQRATEEDIGKMNAIIDKMEQSLGNLRLFNDYDLEFHLAIAEGSKNSVIVATLDTIRDALYEQVQEIQSLPGAAQRALDFHGLITAAIRLRDAALAEKHMLKHIKDVEKAAKRYLMNR
ncbi:MAG TPA: FadR/GntR family transcriptional regulator [Bacillota bacterium]|nr:FadR/GntR family transcriptional regulator [Bacillota bacterium]